MSYYKSLAIVVLVLVVALLSATDYSKAAENTLVVEEVKVCMSLAYQLTPEGADFLYTACSEDGYQSCVRRKFTRYRLSSCAEYMTSFCAKTVENYRLAVLEQFNKRCRGL